MKTSIEMVNDVFKVINVPSVKSLIDGVLIRYERPFKSTKTDIVVNSLLLNNEAYQSGEVNINIHVPNLQGIVLNGVTDNNQPDLVKMATIYNAIKPILNKNNFDDFSIYAYPLEPIRDADNTWFANIRLEYHSFNNEFKN